MKNDEFPTYAVIIFSVMVFYFIAFQAPLGLGWSAGPNYENVTVDTRVNITQSKPVVISVNVDVEENITLTAGGTKLVNCNFTVRDYNGWADINKTNGTFWDDVEANVGDSDDENNHYSNTNCSTVGNDGEYLSYWQCNFSIYYYANNGSDWKCNVTAIDNYYATNNNFSASNYNTTAIIPLYALNLTQEIDFGNMAVEDTSVVSETADIINFGNMDINISLYGFGGDDISRISDFSGLAFVCEIGNISIGNERFSLIDQEWSLMTNLTSTSDLIDGLTMPQRTAAEVINTTYWRLYVPPNPFGQCNGSIVFEAEIS
ncbi:MAG: hypothetical protein KKF65_05680 [Nanoarchaeota archaeon]|nr:hypothetical protein [Nanoarchaeota archaeon]